MVGKIKTPRTKYPRNIENSYTSNLRGFVAMWKKVAMQVAKKHIFPLVKGGNDLLKVDASDDPIEQVLGQLDAMAFELQNLQPKYLLDQSTGQFVRALNTFSYKNVKSQVAILGVDPISDNKDISDYVKGKIAENTSLIKSMQSAFTNKLQDDIYRLLTTGCNQADIIDSINSRKNMAYSHAKLIANDQTGSIISQLNSYRVQKAGGERYIWQSLEDERVRPRHEELDGQEFNYDDPNGGDDGQLPGEPINCRCVAEPIIEI